MALTLKELWYIRNAIIHQKGPFDIQASIGRIGEKFKEYSRVFSLPQNSLMAQPKIRWSPPPTNFVKLNVDAAIAQNSSAIAVVARNEQGAVLMAWSKMLPKRFPITLTQSLFISERAIRRNSNASRGKQFVFADRNWNSSLIRQLSLALPWREHYSSINFMLHSPEPREGPEANTYSSPSCPTP